MVSSDLLLGIAGTQADNPAPENPGYPIYSAHAAGSYFAGRE
jgi:hypothetical protein